MKILSNKTSISTKQIDKTNATNTVEKEIQNKKNSPISSKSQKKSTNPDFEKINPHKKTEQKNILKSDSQVGSMVLRRSYGMVVSGFENVAKQQQLNSEAAEQFGKTLSIRIKELNDESIQLIKDLPEYKSFSLENIYDLGDEITDLIQDPENYLKGFALLKNPKFATLMESTESVHRSFAESMKDNGEERLLFGMLKMIKDFGGLVGLQESTKINQNNSSVNVKA